MLKLLSELDNNACKNDLSLLCHIEKAACVQPEKSSWFLVNWMPTNSVSPSSPEYSKVQRGNFMAIKGSSWRKGLRNRPAPPSHCLVLFGKKSLWIILASGFQAVSIILLIVQGPDVLSKSQYFCFQNSKSENFYSLKQRSSYYQLYLQANSFTNIFSFVIYQTVNIHNFKRIYTEEVWTEGDVYQCSRITLKWCLQNGFFS